MQTRSLGHAVDSFKAGLKKILLYMWGDLMIPVPYKCNRMVVFTF